MDLNLQIGKWIKSKQGAPLFSSFRTSRCLQVEQMLVAPVCSRFQKKRRTEWDLWTISSGHLHKTSSIFFPCFLFVHKSFPNWPAGEASHPWLSTSWKLDWYFHCFHLLNTFQQLSQKVPASFWNLLYLENLRGEQGWKKVHQKNPKDFCFEWL